MRCYGDYMIIIMDTLIYRIGTEHSTEYKMVIPIIYNFFKSIKAQTTEKIP